MLLPTHFFYTFLYYTDMGAVTLIMASYLVRHPEAFLLILAWFCVWPNVCVLSTDPGIDTSPGCSLESYEDHLLPFKDI